MAIPGSVALDIRYALRSFRRSPVFSTVVLLTLVSGIAAVTTIFSYLNAVYLTPLPYHEAHRVVNIGERPYGLHARPSSAHAVQLLREGTQSFERVSAWELSRGSMIVGGAPRALDVLHVDTAFAALFALRPEAGRLITREELLGNAPVAMISSNLWDARFGSDSAAIGTFVTLANREHEIVGVLPNGFRYPYQTDAVVPFDERLLAERAAKPRADGDDSEYHIIARLRPSMTREAARVEVDALNARLPQARRSNSRLTLYDEMLDRRGRQFLPLPELFLGAGFFVLLIACANVGNLFLARGAERQAEIAIRASLGASRFRLVRQHLTETLLIGGAAAMIGTVVAPALVRLFLSFVPTHGFPSWFRVETDYRILGFAAGVLLLVTIMVGLSPALEGTRFDLTRALKAGGESTGTTKRVVASSSRALVVQLALGVALLVCSVLLVRTHFRIAEIDVGYPAKHIASVQPFFEHARYDGFTRQGPFLEEIARGLAGHPSVSSIAVRGGFSGLRDRQGKNISDQGPRDYDPRLIPDGQVPRGVRVWRYVQHTVTDEYFAMLELRIREGRGFTPEDVAGSAPVVVVSASAAEALWPQGGSVGHRIQVGAQGEAATIVGVVDDVFDLYGGGRGYTNRPVPTIYYNSRQAVASNAQLLARGPGDVAALFAFMASRVSAADPMLVLSREQTLASSLEMHLMGTRIFGGLIATFALVALVLSVIGTYGVVAFGVARRTREIGIRMALGGTRGDVMRHVMGGTARFVLVGLLLGVALGMGLGRLLRIFLFGITETDVVTYVIVCAIFAVVAGLACWLPARRATRVDPLVALRAD